ncbi:hypothetical protein LC593_10800 [Nostoc sp. CHAB 5844]|nr:hypothetical protein [Nostoc sp. CHAB 5844]
MSEHKIGQNYHVEDWLTVPGAEVIIRSKDDGKVRASEIAATVNRLAVNRPDVKVEYFIKIHP